MDLTDILRGGRQCDDDGTEIIMSREACCVAADTIESLRAELAAEREKVREKVRELEADNFKLAAGQCCVDGGLLGDDYGNAYCTAQKQLAAAQLENQRLREHLQAHLDLVVAQSGPQEVMVDLQDALSTPTETAALDAYVESWKKDAERYRAIKNSTKFEVSEIEDDIAWLPDDLDEAVDAAIAAQENKE